MAGPAPLYAEHPQDVLGQWLAWRQAGPVALVVVAATEGGSVRSPGALMAVSASGLKCGYISGGCVDADVVQACAKLVTEVVKDEEVKKVSRPLFTILSAIMISCFF